MVTDAGAVSVTAPRVNDKRVDPAESVEQQRFSSKTLMAWSRKSPKVAEVLPLLYLHGLSSLDFTPALEQFLGSGSGLSASTVTRLTTQWQEEAKAFAVRDLSQVDLVYLWVDGIHLKVRLEQEKLCLLVMIGVRAEGKKELVALTDGYRKSTESWAALRDVFPEMSEQRCWFHKSANVFAALPKSAHPGRSPRCSRSTTPRTWITRKSRRWRSPSTTARSSPRPSQRSLTNSMCRWSSTTRCDARQPRRGREGR